jgi:hypothetical protein
LLTSIPAACFRLHRFPANRIIRAVREIGPAMSPGIARCGPVKAGWSVSEAIPFLVTDVGVARPRFY